MSEAATPCAVKLTCDVGGTFTDVVVSDANGRLAIGKSLTTYGRLGEGLLTGIGVAAERLGTNAQELLHRGELFVYSTTQATNAILTGTTAKTALLCTRGFPDILVRREGGSMHPYDFNRPYPEPYIPKRLTFEITERIGAEGDVVLALDEQQACAVLRQLAAIEIEAVAVCLLWCTANAAHEQRLGELIEEELPGIPYTLSHRLNPIVREYRRASCTAIDASLKPLMQRHLHDVEQDLRAAGFAGELVAATSIGGVLPMAGLIERPVYAAKSGPSLAPVAGAHRLAGAGARRGDRLRHRRHELRRQPDPRRPRRLHARDVARRAVRRPPDRPLLRRRALDRRRRRLDRLARPGRTAARRPAERGLHARPGVLRQRRRAPDRHRRRGRARLDRPRPLPRRHDGARRRGGAPRGRDRRRRDGRDRRTGCLRDHDRRERAHGLGDQGADRQPGDRPAPRGDRRRWRRGWPRRRRDRPRARLQARARAAHRRRVERLRRPALRHRRRGRPQHHDRQRHVGFLRRRRRLRRSRGRACWRRRRTGAPTA